MEITNDELLQKVKDICKEKNLQHTDTFLNNFVNHKVGLFTADSDNDMLLNVITTSLEDSYHAYSQAAKVEAEKRKTLEQELEKIKKSQEPPTTKPVDDKVVELPEEARAAIEYFKKHQMQEQLSEKKKEIFTKATANFDDAKREHFKLFFETQQFATDSDTDAEVERITKAYTALFKSNIGNATPKNSGGNGGNQTNPLIDIAEQWRKKNGIS